jgi:hypothetical protein
MRDQGRRRASAGVLLFAFLLAACGGASSTTTPTPQPTPTPTPTGGEHAFTVGNPPVTLTVTLPPGWEADASAARRTAADGSELVISAWAPTAVYGDPCHWSGTDEAAGPTAADVATALARQPTRQGREATVQLGGVAADRVFMSVPNAADFTTCDGGEFRSWIGSNGVSRMQAGPGETDEVYVIQVGNAVVLLDAAYFDASTPELAEIHGIVQSLQLPPVPTPTASPAAS